MAQSKDTGILELIAVGAIIYVMWRMTRKVKTIPVSEEIPPEHCENVVYKPLSIAEYTPANLLGKGWCYRGDLSVQDFTQGTGTPYMEEQAQEFTERKQEEAIRATNRSCIQFRLINTTSSAITSKAFNTTDDVDIFDGTDDIVIPDAPVASSASGVTSSGFTANWASASRATGYYLDVATDSAFTSYVSGFENLDVSNVTSYAVTGLSETTTYYYRLRAYNDYGTSANSNTVSQLTTLVEITIGTQVWALENVSINISGSKVYDDDEDNRAIYGGLYSWDMIDEIEALYPGYHVPTATEWQELITYLGGDSVAGGHLKEAGTSHWSSPNTGADNSSGFTGLPAGYYLLGYLGLTTRGYFWASTEDVTLPETRANIVDLEYNNTESSIGVADKTLFFSVRLIKD